MLISSILPMTQEHDDLLDIPDFLRRKPGDRPTLPPLREEPRPKLNRTAYSVYKERAEARAKREERSAERAKYKVEVARRKEQYEQDRMTVLGSLRKGNNTVGKIRNHTGMDTALIQRCLRWLIRNERVVKASAKTYKEAT